jgi:hypothetical protein
MSKSETLAKDVTAKRLLSRLDDVRVPLAVTFIVYALFVVVKLSVHHFDPSYFVMTGLPACDPARTPPGLTVPSKDHGGYDGQFYYRLALDPFTSKGTEHGISFDLPSHRQQRLVYPFLAWALSLGHAERLPWILLAINFAGVVALGALAGRVARALGHHALVGLVVPFYAGYVFTLARDLTEIVAACFLVGTLLAARRGKVLAAAALATLAMLSRETTLVVSVALFSCALYALLRDRSRARVVAVVAYAVPIATYAAWQIVLRYNWGRLPSDANSMSLSPPFVGLARFFVDAFTHAYLLDLLHVALILAFGVVVLSRLRASGAPPHEKLAWFGYAVLLTLLRRESFWDDQCSYLRASAEYFVLGAFVLLSPLASAAPRPGTRGTLSIVFGLWIAVTAFHLFASSDVIANIY